MSKWAPQPQPNTIEPEVLKRVDLPKPRSDTSRSPEPIDVALARLASRASPRLLKILTAIGIGLGITLPLLTKRWPLASLGAAIAFFGAWGLIEHYYVRPHSRRVAIVQSVVAVLGLLAAAIASLSLLFWLLGPAPIL